MKRPGKLTLLLVTRQRIARADFANGATTCKNAQRPPKASSTDAVRAALALGGSATGAVWVLSEDVWSQNVALSPAQVSGLSPEQLGRALSFEVEPFSGIPAAESVTGYKTTGPGAFAVVEMSRADRDTIQRVVSDSGGRLAGIASADAPPAEELELPGWLAQWPQRLEGGTVPVITPPARAPSPQRFLVAGCVLAALAIALLIAISFSNSMARRDLDRRNGEFLAASRDLDAANKQIAALKVEQTTLEKLNASRTQVFARRGALQAVLATLAATRTEEIVVRGFAAEGPSHLVVNGLSLEAGAVDELSIVLSHKLKSAGWTAQARKKVGTKNLPSGGPWEFAVLLTHEEAALEPSPRSSE